MYNSIECRHPWKTPRIRVQGLDRRPYVLTPYEYISILELLQSRKDKIPSNSFKGLRKSTDITERSFIQFIWQIDYVTNSRKSMWNCSIFLIVADCFSLIIVTNLFCSRCLRIVVYGSVVCSNFCVTFFIDDRYDFCSRSNTHGAVLSPGVINAKKENS